MTAPLELDVVDEMHTLGVRRLTHFTLCSNLPQIFEVGAILSSTMLAAQGTPNFVTDFGRYDGHPELICCNVEYPNGYYFAQAKAKNHLVNFREWAVLLVNPQLAARPGSLFSPVNAAKGSGRELEPGADGLRRLWASQIGNLSRSSSHWPASPTDVQAEVQVPGPISLADVHGIVVLDDEEVRIQQARLTHLGHDPSMLEWYVSPEFFSVTDVRIAIRAGQDIPLRRPVHLTSKEPN